MHVCPAVDMVFQKPHSGGPILPPGAPLVIIGGQPAARRLDKTICVGVGEGDPQDPISLGSFSVLIGGQPAARMGDPTAHGGTIALGFPTVLIGDVTRTGGSSRKFATAEEAARAALEEANPESIKTNVEWGGLVYRNPDGTFGYTAPSRSTEANHFDPTTASVPPGATVVGDYHTHGDYSVMDGLDPETAVRTSDPTNDHLDCDNFSPDDKAMAKERARGNPGYRSYLGTPGGTFRELDPSTGNVRNIN
jgi:uncharacterized Zn-binding protein involved in type VI secretion